MLKKHSGGIPPKIESYIRIHVASLYKTNLFHYQERDDLLQELALFYIERFYKKDEDVPDELLFIAIKRKAQQILRSRLSSMKSGVFFTESLNGMFAGEELDLPSNFCLEDLENQIDINMLTRPLSQKQKEALSLIFEGYSIDEVAKKLHMSRSFLHRIRKKINELKK